MRTFKPTTIADSDTPSANGSRKPKSLPAVPVLQQSRGTGEQQQSSITVPIPWDAEPAGLEPYQLVDKGVLPAYTSTVVQRIKIYDESEPFKTYQASAVEEVKLLVGRLDAVPGLGKVARAVASVKAPTGKLQKTFLEVIRVFNILECFLDEILPKLETIKLRLEKGKAFKDQDILSVLMADLQEAKPDEVETAVNNLERFVTKNLDDYFGDMTTEQFISYLDASIGLGSGSAPAISGEETESGLPIFQVGLTSGHLPSALVRLIEQISASVVVGGKAYGKAQSEVKGKDDKRSVAPAGPGKMRSWHDDEGGYLPRHGRVADDKLDETARERRTAYERFYTDEFRTGEGYQSELLAKHAGALGKRKTNRKDISEEDIRAHHETGYVEVNADGWRQGGQLGRIIYDYRNDRYFLTATHYHPFQVLEKGGIKELGEEGFDAGKKDDPTTTRNHVFLISGTKNLSIKDSSASGGKKSGKESSGYVPSDGQAETLRNQHLFERPIAPNGDCLFNSLIHMGAFAGDATAFRTRISQYVLNPLNADALTPISQAFNTTRERIAGQIAQPGNYFGIAGHITPELITMSLGIRLRIINGDGSITAIGAGGNVYTLIRFGGGQPHYHATTDVDPAAPAH